MQIIPALKTSLKIFVAVVTAFAAASACFFSLAETIASVGRGTVAQAGLAEASWGDRLVAMGFHDGGWRIAEIVRAALVFIPCFVVLVLLLLAVSRLSARAGTVSRWLAWMICVGVTMWGLWRGWTAWHDQIRDMRLLAPVTLLETAQKDGGRVFYNPSAIWNVATFAPGLLDPTINQYVRTELVQAPMLWREQERSKPSSAVFIGSQISEARPLIEHLLASPDWHLALVDNQGLLFLRGAGQNFSPPQLESVSAQFPTPREHALFLAQSAISFEAAGFKTDARVYIDAALKITPKDFDVLVRAASLSASHGRWSRSRSLAEKALKINPSSAQAAYIYAHALLEMGAADKAFEAATRLVRSQPRDLTVLFLHARIARTIHDYSAEINSLEKILALTEANNVSSTRIHVYLGQAWAQKGFPNQALEHYHAALQGKLTPGEENDIREAIQTIETNRQPETH